MQLIYKKEIIPAIFLIFGISIFAWICNSNKKDNFNKNGVITNAFVTGYKYDYRGRIEVQFKFSANAKIIKGNTAFPELKGGAEKYLIDKYFPVIYINTNPETNELLASSKKFKKFSISIPDSLVWLKQIERSW